MATAVSTLEDAEKMFRDVGMFALVLQETLLFLGHLSNDTKAESISVNGQQINVICYPCDGRQGEDVLIADPSFVENVDGQWQFRNDPPAIFGGINPYAVRHPTDSLDSAIEVAWNYYFGEPVVLEGWIIPIHRHPAWDVNAIRAAWERQTALTADEWKKRLNEDLAALQRHDRASDPEPNFNPFAFYHLTSPLAQRHGMHLRMDCGEVCRVESSASSVFAARTTAKGPVQ
ncbi:MAG TPA: hypothetical protein VNH11_09130 [Pirellulales bacterium]|nr:hypothetical protein [Pirellulales bacterium]